MSSFEAPTAASTGGLMSLKSVNPSAQTEKLKVHQEITGGVTVFYIKNSANIWEVEIAIRYEAGCQISNVTINTESQTKDQSQLKGITKYSNVKIDHDGRLTCWKAFGIGEGQRITMSSFNQEGTNLNVLEDFSLPKHIEGSIKTSNSIVNDQVPREGDLYCPEMTCSRKFKSYSELEDHCFVGDHALCPTHDLIKLQWKGVCLDISSCSVKTREGSLQTGDSTLQSGWGLKKDRKSVRFSLKTKNYLKEIFDSGEKSGQKAMCNNVAKYVFT
ncbi:unnamed protein product [Mytilus edulis]|uniref:C2H2-type domain-containing protein n=1 Tax=Mytilus edulis TaxID=6550 RepID=A0A8S3Q7L5_MYTED|nr:unnamed protein product [Mytilus edulis]